jgi:hypothetical protein
MFCCNCSFETSLIFPIPIKKAIIGEIKKFRHEDITTRSHGSCQVRPIVAGEFFKKKYTPEKNSIKNNAKHKIAYHLIIR